MDADTKAKVEAALERVREALKGTDAAAIKAATEDLQQVMHGAAEQMYQAAQAEQPSGEATGADDAGKKDKSVDADFEVVED